MFSAYTKGLKKGDISFINYDNIAKALQISEQTSQNKWTLETPKAKFLPCYQKICHGSEKPCALPHTEQWLQGSSTSSNFLGLSAQTKHLCTQIQDQDDSQMCTTQNDVSTVKTIIMKKH